MKTTVEPQMRKLQHEDALQLREGVEYLGLERVAGILSRSENKSGRAGRPPKPEILLQLKIAHITRNNPKRRLHSIAKEVAVKAHPYRNPGISLESLISKLERDFRRDRQFWLSLALKRPEPSDEAIADDAGRIGSSSEYRAMAYIIEAVPRPLDLFDTIVSEAGNLGNQQIKLVKKAGREQVQPYLSQAIQAQRNSAFITGVDGIQRIPRNFFDLVAPQLSQIEIRRRRAIGQIVN